MSTDEPRADQPGTRERLEAERKPLEAEIAALRARGQGPPAKLRTLERDLAGRAPSLDRVRPERAPRAHAARRARADRHPQAEVDRLAQPPAAYGIVIEAFDDGTADILTSGRKMHVAVSPSRRGGPLCPAAR